MGISRTHPVRPFIEHGGIRYYRDKQGWRASACKGHKRLHAALWEEANGAVPEGFHLFCSAPERPSLDNIELRQAYAGMAAYRTSLQSAADDQWRVRAPEPAVLSGLNRRQIAQRVGVSFRTANRWCRRLAVPLARPGPKPKYDENIRELHAKGLLQREISARLGISQSCVAQRISILGLPRHPRGRRPNEPTA